MSASAPAASSRPALANGITPHEMCRDVHRERRRTPSRSSRRCCCGRLPRSTAARRCAAAARARDRLALPVLAARARFMSRSLQRLGRAIPTGLFNGDDIDRYLRRLFNAPGPHQRFPQARARKLYLVATDLDSGASVEFGAPGVDHVPISRAVQASAALPGLFPPVEIDGRYFVDGALKQDAARLGRAEARRRPGALPQPAGAVRRRRAAHVAAATRNGWSTAGCRWCWRRPSGPIIHSRMEVGLAALQDARTRAPTSCCSSRTARRRDVLHQHVQLLEPSPAVRARLSEDARGAATRGAHELAPVLARHGITLRLDVVARSGADIW